MELPREPEPDVLTDEYPPLSETCSGPLPSDKFMLESQREIETTSPQPDTILRESTPCIDPALIMRPFNFKHLRTSSLPEATLAVPKTTDEHCSPTVVPGSILPFRRHTEKEISNTESALVRSEVAIGNYLPQADTFLGTKDIKNHRRSISSGEADTIPLVPKLSANKHELQVTPHMPSLHGKECLESLSKSEADTTSPQPKADARKSALCVHSESLPSSSTQDKPASCLDTKTTTLEPHITSDGYVLWLDPTSNAQPQKRFRLSANAGNFSLLPPQEWTRDTYQPLVPAASIPLPTSRRDRRANDSIRAAPTIPTITVTAPDDRAEEPSEAAGRMQRADEAGAVDSSRLHPDAAWSRLDNRTHRRDLALVDEDEDVILRLQRRALRNTLAGLGSVLGEMGMERNLEFHRILSEMAAAPPGSREG